MTETAALTGFAVGKRQLIQVSDQRVGLVRPARLWKWSR